MIKPLVSIIIPVKNRSVSLKRALNSILLQTYTHFEVLVVDDKSEEDLVEVVSGFNDPRFKYFLNDMPTSNANVCRNIGLERAQGEYTAMLDSDDEWLPDHLESKIIFIEDNQCDGVFGSAYVDNGTNRRLRLSRPMASKESMLDYLLTTGKAPTPTHVYKTGCARQIRWDESLKRHQDFDFSARFSKKYLFKACEVPTAIIHWNANEKRNVDVQSQEMFIKKHSSSISPNVLVKYLTETCSLWNNETSEETIRVREFFKQLAISNIRFMSYADYQLIVSNNSVIDKVISRLNYAARIIFKS